VIWVWPHTTLVTLYILGSPDPGNSSKWKLLPNVGFALKYPFLSAHLTGSILSFSSRFGESSLLWFFIVFYFLDKVSLCSPGWPGTCDPPASADSWMLGAQESGDHLF
jgi:hypothetical protein